MTSAPSASRAHPRTLLRAIRELGPKSMLLYLQHRAALRTGWIRRRTPIFDWGDRPAHTRLRETVPSEPEAYAALRSSAARFFFDPSADLALSLANALGDSATVLIEEAEGILRGRFVLFGGPTANLGFPPNWHAFAPIAGGETAPSLDSGRHWSAYDELRVAADIKLLWEPSRFAWAFTLGRAYRLTRDARFAEGFWSLFQSWRTASRPNEGPHWISAQEVALRILALSFALYAFGPWLTPSRMMSLCQAVAVHAGRIPFTLAYSRSLANNHLASEAAGLYTAGLLFPEFRLAPRWRRLGRSLLVTALESQFYPDGGHVQHSLNYHRLVLQAGLWCARLADINGEPLPPEPLACLRRAAEFLAALTDPKTGAAPNFGANDGAQILPLTACDFADQRPTLHLAAVTLGLSPQAPGPWQEASIWFGAPRPDGAQPSDEAPRSDFENAGIYLARGDQASALLRAARFTSRPSHSDQLHVDLRWRGQAIAIDAGSYLYAAPPPWDNGLALTAAHNTLRLDGEEPMQRAGPFLWLQWAQARVLGRWSSPGGALEALAAEHVGYRRLGAVHRRTLVRAGDDLWLVADDLTGAVRRAATLTWLLPDFPSASLDANTLRLHSPAVGLSLQIEAAGSEADVRCALYRMGQLIDGHAPHLPSETWGWRSPTYALREPALTFVAEIEGQLPYRLITWFAFAAAQRQMLQVEWAAPGDELCALRSLTFRGDQLRFVP
jgi:hypothetical protein